MKTVYVNLSTTKLVQSFVATLTKLDGDFELVYEGYKLDARSLMGIFSLDRTRPIALNIYSDCEEYLEILRPFLAFSKEAL